VGLTLGGVPGLEDLFGLIAENLPQADAFAGLVVGNYPPRDTLRETSRQRRGSDRERRELGG